MQTCMSKNAVNCNSVTVELPLYDTIRVYTFIRFVANPHYTIFIKCWSTLPLALLRFIASREYTPLLSPSRMPGGAPCWSSRKLSFASQLVTQALRPQETALDCLRICSKVTKGYIWSTTTLCHRAYCLCLVDT